MKVFRNFYLESIVLLLFNPFHVEVDHWCCVDHIVNSIIALTMSFVLFFSAFIALDLDTFACDMTSSMSLASTPVASTSSSSSSSSGMAAGGEVTVPCPRVSVGCGGSAAAVNFDAASI